MVGGADPFILPDATESPFDGIFGKLGAHKEATEATFHDRDMPRMACPSLHGRTGSVSREVAVLSLVLRPNP